MVNQYQKPNTFFVGAPKCGTTAMAKYLDTHPDVFVSKPKEPDWFRKGPKNSEFGSEEEYLRICFGGSSDHDVVIDANIQSLYTSGAISRILDFNPNAQFLVMLRNPVDAAYSFYSMLKSRYKEDAESFQKAWYLQAERANGKKLPQDKPPEYHHMWQYDDIFKYGEQIEHLYSMVNRDHVCIIKFSNFKDDPEKAYKKVLSFFDLPHIVNTEFPKVNQDIRKKSKYVDLLIDYAGYMKRWLGIPYLNTGFFSNLYSLNATDHDREPLSQNFREELRQYFSKDAQKLQDITGMEILE
jgi:hypothetical protein